MNVEEFEKNRISDLVLREDLLRVFGIVWPHVWLIVDIVDE